MAARINEPVFVISVAARLVEMHPQTLRKYEREGLIAPSRTVTNLRLYSDQDIELYTVNAEIQGTLKGRQRVLGKCGRIAAVRIDLHRRLLLSSIVKLDTVRIKFYYSC